jgi:hypothetical protein
MTARARRVADVRVAASSALCWTQARMMATGACGGSPRSIAACSAARFIRGVRSEGVVVSGSINPHSPDEAVILSAVTTIEG